MPEDKWIVICPKCGTRTGMALPIEPGPGQPDTNIGKCCQCSAKIDSRTGSILRMPQVKEGQRDLLEIT